MRLLYILLFLTLPLSFVSIASQRQDQAPLKKNGAIKVIQLQQFSHHPLQQDHIQKDFLGHGSVKIGTRISIILLLLFSFIFFKNQKIIRITFKNLRFRYSSLHKMLYPKHAFW